MKSPRFDIRAAPLRRIFSHGNLERVWSKKVRVSMRQQFINDGLEHFDFHVARGTECRKLSQLILSGEYVPERAQRILIEKSKGLCRQLVIPSARDALVLQCLSDAFYAEIRSRAPTDRAFFEPKELLIPANTIRYFCFLAKLPTRTVQFFTQSRLYSGHRHCKLLRFHFIHTSPKRDFSILGAEESILDMLIYVLSSLLWQPDYMPRIEIGLPQINLDAPRLLAHCFLYELDSYLASDASRDFVRYMDDIDVGVDSIAEAKNVLKSIDLVLQTKQVRLNSGKTIILTRADAIKHFRIIENTRLDVLHDRIRRKIRAHGDLRRERLVVELRIRRGLASRAFDDGNGDKILKRLISLSTLVHVRIAPRDLLRIFVLRPTVRENVCAYVRGSDLTLALSRVLAEAAESGLLVDDAAMVDLVNHLVETTVTTTHRIHANLARIIAALDPTNYFSLYCKLWMQSKYDSPFALLATITSTRDLWVAHDRLGRIIGAFQPIFLNTVEEHSYLQILGDSRNSGIRDAYKFHLRLTSELRLFNSMFDALKNPNPSRGTGITHAKFLLTVSTKEWFCCSHSASNPEEQPSCGVAGHLLPTYRSATARLKRQRPDFCEG